MQVNQLINSSHCCHQSAHGLGTEASNAYFDGEQPSTPAFFFTKMQELCLLCLLPLVGLPIPCIPCYVSSMTISFFPLLDHSSTSGHRVVWFTSGKTSLSPKSTSMFQPVVPPRIDERCVVCVLLVSPDLTKVICP